MNTRRSWSKKSIGLRRLDLILITRKLWLFLDWIICLELWETEGLMSTEVAIRLFTSHSLKPSFNLTGLMHCGILFAFTMFGKKIVARTLCTRLITSSILFFRIVKSCTRLISIWQSMKVWLSTMEKIKWKSMSLINPLNADFALSFFVKALRAMFWDDFLIRAPNW